VTGTVEVRTSRGVLVLVGLHLSAALAGGVGAEASTLLAPGLTRTVAASSPFVALCAALAAWLYARGAFPRHPLGAAVAFAVGLTIIPWGATLLRSNVGAPGWVALRASAFVMLVSPLSTILAFVLAMKVTGPGSDAAAHGPPDERPAEGPDRVTGSARP
jgi:hypothetical protein